MSPANSSEGHAGLHQAHATGPRVEHGAQVIHGVKATFRLYYVMEQNEPSTAQLVVVGIDIRRSGHYEYFSVDQTVDLEDQLHARNKTEVRRWLQEKKSAEGEADRGTLARIAEPPEASICDMLLKHAVAKLSPAIANKLQGGPGEPGADFIRSPERVQVCGGPVRFDGWTGLFECCYTDKLSRKLVMFVLRDTNGGREFVAVHGGETRPNSRRYMYQSVRELGGTVFHNRQEALDWIYSQFRFVCNADSSSAKQLNAAHSRGGVAVASVFSDEGLASWALSDPDSSLMKQLTHAASLLDDLRDKSISTGDNAAIGTDRAVIHIIHTLDELSAPRVGMQALDMSHVVFSVLPLVSHPHPEIAQRASQLIRTWRDQAMETEILVQEALTHLCHHA